MTFVHKKRGFTLVEVIVVMAVFISVLMITASAFDTILKQASKLFGNEESNIEGVIGLEMLRHDLQQAGYGLFTEQVNYADEAATAPASDYNDAPNNVPRPVVAGNDLATGLTMDNNSLLAGSDYLAIKGTTVARNAAAQKWTFLRVSSSQVTPQAWASASENFSSNDRVVVLRKQFGNPVRSTLVPDPAGDFYYAYSDVAFNNLSSAGTSVYTAYGIDRAGVTPRFPFNRTDYFIGIPSPSNSIKLPPHCAPGTGVLYKTTVNLADGMLTYIPVLDCVLDMQVVLGWDMNSDGMIDTYSSANGSDVSSGITEGSIANVQAALANANNNTIATTPNIRNNLKMLKVYVLAQYGKRDPGYTNSSPIILGDTWEKSLTRPAGLALAANQLNYRWKQYRIVVRPQNLLSNQ